MPETTEWTRREKAFQTNLQKVIELRARSRSWTPGITMFMDYEDHEYTRLLGYKGRRAQSQTSSLVESSRVEEAELASVKAAPFVDTMLNKPLTAMVKDQGSCGSCWAAGAIATLEGVVEQMAPHLLHTMSAASVPTGAHLQIPGGGVQFPFSPNTMTLKPGLSMQAVTACTPNPRNCGGSGGCGGATAELAYDTVRESGVPLDVVWPYTSGTTGQTGTCANYAASASPKIGIGGYRKLPSNQYMPLVQALYQRGHPIAVAVDASMWNFYQSGIYSDTEYGSTGDFTVNHEVTLVGYMGKQANSMGYYTIKNSWGPMWGEKGFIRVEMKDNEQQHCGWDNDSHIGLACDGDPDRVWVCGTCGILYDSVYPVQPYLMQR